VTFLLGQVGLQPFCANRGEPTHSVHVHMVRELKRLTIDCFTLKDDPIAIRCHSGQHGGGFDVPSTIDNPRGRQSTK
jgi:hypothetical protein